MSGLYYVELVDVLTAAGVRCAVGDVNAGWEHRARSSGGFGSPPLGVQWHHTASSTSPENDLHWQIVGCDDAPVGNMLLDRDGIVWPVAAGAANTAGKGGPLELSRGTVPKDTGNSTTWAIEVANNGVGEPWPVSQVDAYFAASNALNALFGNLPTDVFTHALGAGDGWTDRKIDPATADAVEGPWRPGSVNSSGTWSLVDIRAECARRAGQAPPETVPEPPGAWTPPPFPGTGDYGCSSSTCRAWQDEMIRHGYISDNPANHDGVWGDGMHNACRKMQQTWGWSDADGIGGEHTWPHLASRGAAPCPRCGR